MKSKGLITDNLSCYLSDKDNLENNIISILELFDHAQEYEIEYWVYENLMYGYSNSDFVFLDWLFDQSDNEIHDIKQELIINLSRFTPKYDDENIVDILQNSTETFLLGKTQNEFLKQIANISDFMCFLQSRLIQIDSRDEFAKELPKCFRNIYFEENIDSTLGTLTRKFETIREEIVNHLGKLDAFYPQFVELLSLGTSYINLAKKFTEFSNIACSPQAGRDGIEALVRKYYNSITGREENIVCELHTKFNNNGSQKPNRLYFFPGKKGIKDGKIIVIHIGEHL